MRNQPWSGDSGPDDNLSISAEVAFAALDEEEADELNEDHTSWLPTVGTGALRSESVFLVEGTGRVRVGGEVVARVPLGMEPGGWPATLPSQNRPRGHGFFRFQQGCSCRTCCTGYCDAVGVVALRIEGWTLEAIGEVISLTRERARQIAQKYAPWRPWEAVQAEQRAERALLEQARDNVQRELFSEECPTCGEVFRASGVKRYCAPECRELYSTLRYHLDDERRMRQRRHMAAWVVRNSERAPVIHYRQALKILEHGPEHGSGKRWLVEGTKVWRVAVDACRRDLPVFDQLPTDVRRQVQQHLGKPVDESNDAPATGITAEEARAALDAFFTDEELG